jgi:hypothetical protein
MGRRLDRTACKRRIEFFTAGMITRLKIAGATTRCQWSEALRHHESPVTVERLRMRRLESIDCRHSNAFEPGQIVQQARRANPTLEIVARAHYDAEIELSATRRTTRWHGPPTLRGRDCCDPHLHDQVRRPPRQALAPTRPRANLDWPAQAEVTESWSAVLLSRD